ncbi:hypothetical protein MTR_6g033120 [Medicago truncatula]|uniref:Uncharacterized protein n=1 Tax=Medicago truncatula TaxID=3880 RepID=A0A072U7G6_MEDTR|nr:hypothetical protein MTR_6g033120 [Medicago truncatula]
MEFFKTSWANLADQDLENQVNNEIQHGNTHQNNPTNEQMTDASHEEPFQVVRRRKKSKKASSSQHQTYQTSRVDKLNLGK